MNRRWVHSDHIDEPIGFEAYANTSGAGSGTEHPLYADRQNSILYVTNPATNAVEAAYEYSGCGEITQTQGTLRLHRPRI